MKDIIIFDVEVQEKKEVERKEQEDLTQELLKNKYLIPDSTIPSILLKSVLEYATPIIEEIPRVEITIKDITKRANIKIESKVSVEKGISIIFDRNIECIYSKNLGKSAERIKVAAGQMVVVIGLKVPAKILSNQWLDVYDYMATDKKYNKKMILKSGLYNVYNCYKNYFFNAYLNPNFDSVEFVIMFTNKAQENNAKINSLRNICMAYNNLHNSVYLLTIQSINQKKVENRLLSPNIYVSENAEIIDWMIKNKLIDKQESRFVNINVEFNRVLNKIKWYGGPNESGSKKYVEQLRNLVDAEISANQERIKVKKYNIAISHKKIISYDKYGTTNIFQLTPAQQKNITQEYIKEINKTVEVNNVISPLVAKLNENINAEITGKDLNKSLNDVLNVISKDDQSKLEKQYKLVTPGVTFMFKLKDKSGAEVCPHTLEYAHNLLNNNAENALNLITNKYGSFMSSSKSKQEQRDTYCKICGELLSEYDEEEVAYKEKDNYVLSIEDDEVFSMVKKELQYVISYYIEQPPNSSISLRGKDGIIDLLSGIIRVKILEVQNSLIRIKTLGDNDMWLLINIYIYIYIFAVLTQFVFANPDVLHFKQAVSISSHKYQKVPKKGGKVNVTNASKAILEQLLKRKQGKENLERLINYSLELIKKIKYSDIVNSKYITLANIKELFLDAYKWTMTLNYNIESIDDFTNNQKSEFKETDIEQNSLLDYFSLYGKLGRTRQQIESDYKKSIPTYGTIQLEKNAPEEVKLLHKYVVEEQYLYKPVPKNIKCEEIITNFVNENTKEFKDAESYRISILKPYGTQPEYKISKYKLDLPFKLVGNCTKGCGMTYIYQPHDKKGSVGLKEYTRKEIVNWLESNNEAKLKELYSMNCLGSKCVCKEKKDQNVVLFYKYFEQFCPKGELHETIDKKCKKCGITDEIIKSFDVEFYKKYKDVLMKTRKKEAEYINKEMQSRIENKEKNVKEKKFPEWAQVTKDVTDLSKRINIKNLNNLFMSIGLYENLNYQKLESNVIHPYIDATPDAYMNQALTVHNYILYMYRCYYNTKNSEYMIKLPVDLKNLLSKMSQNNKDFSKKLTDLDQTYIEKYDWYSSEKIKPSLLANFCITSLAKLFLTIDDIFKNSKLEKFGQAWVQFYLAKIIGYERFTCSIGLKNLKPLARYEEAEDENDAEDADALNSKFGEYSVDENVEEEYEETGNEFAGDDVDIGEDIDDDLNQDNSFATIES
jgi:hypothetical protein